MLSGRGVGLFRNFFFHILINAARTNYGLKCTYILIACWFLPAGTDDTGSIASLMPSEPQGESIPNLTADVTVVSVVHGRGVLQYTFLSHVVRAPVQYSEGCEQQNLAVCLAAY